MNQPKVIMNAQYNGMPLYNGDKASEGFYEDILGRVYGLLDYHTQKYSKVLVVRFDLRYPKNMTALQCNAAISQFHDRFTRYLKRNGADPKLLWVWEQYNSQNPHYHCMLTVNGHKHRHPQNLYTKAAECWWNAIGEHGNKGLVEQCDKNGPGYYNLHRNKADFGETYYKCFERCSYLAKVFTKVEIPKDMHRYGGSRC